LKSIRFPSLPAKFLSEVGKNACNRYFYGLSMTSAHLDISG
jgi:hypothetical protein